MLLLALLVLLEEPTPPVLQGKPEIPYPAGAVGDADVELQLDIDATGRVTALKVLRAGGAAFDDAALRAARDFRFEPGRDQGEPVPFQVTYTHHFRAAHPLLPPRPPPAHATVRGRILERGTRSPLAFAQISCGPVHTDTDEQGRFALECAPGEITIVSNAPDHARSEWVEHGRAGETVDVVYYVARTATSRYETVVHGRPLREEVARQTLEADEISKMPGTLGDTLRAVLNLPGVARAPFDSGLIIIRGGKPTDSRVYIEGAEVPQLYHFGALSSVVSSDLVGQIEFLPGNFSVRYGRAIAGVIDVDFREARTDRVHGEVNTNVIDTGVLFETPLWGGGLAIAARRSYIDAILPAVVPSSADIDFVTAPRYYDYQALYDHPLGRGKLHLRLYGSDDELTFLLAHPANVRFRGEFDTHIYFHRAQVEWNGKVGENDVQLLGSAGYQSVFAAAGEGFDLSLQVTSMHTRAEASRNVLRNVRVGAGLDAQLAYLVVDARAPQPPREGEVADPGTVRNIVESHQRRDASAIGAYIFSDIDVTPRLRLVPGARFDWYALIERQTIDPRLTARYILSPATTLTAGVGLYSQAPQPQDTDPSFGNPHIGPEHALQLGLGVEQRFRGGLSAQVNGFYKYLYDLSTVSPQTILDDSGPVRQEGVANIGTGHVYGGELLLRQALGRSFFGWLSYTLMRSERSDGPDRPERLFDFDQTHVLTLALHANLPKGWEAGIRFRYVTGDPYTPRIGGLYNSDNDEYLPIFAAINSARLPAYNQLDVRLDKNWVFERWILTAYLDVQNVYNASNVEGLRYQYDFSRSTNLTGLPILPAFGIRGKF